MASLLFLLASCLALTIVGVDVHAATANVRDALITSLRGRASASAPPPDASLPVNVKVELKLLSIDSLCPKTYQLSARAYEIYTWNDSRLTWAQNEFNASYVVLPSTDIWTPDLVIWQDSAEHKLQAEDHRALILPSGEVQMKFGAQHKLNCNGTAWEMFSKSNSGNSKSLPATRKCSFDMSSEWYDINVVDLSPVVSKQTGNSGDGPRQGQAASLDWFKPNAIYDVTSFDAKRWERPYRIGPSTKSAVAVLKFAVLVKQKEHMPHIMDGGGSDGHGGAEAQSPNRRGSNRNEEQNEEDQDMID